MGDSCRFIRTASQLRSSYRLLFAGSKTGSGRKKACVANPALPLYCAGAGTLIRVISFSLRPIKPLHLKKTEKSKSGLESVHSPDSGTALNYHYDAGKQK